MSRNKLKIYLYYIILFFVYTQGFWERFTPFPAQLLLEMAVLVLVVFSFKPVLSPQFSGVILVFGVGLISALATSTFVPYLKSFRFVLYFFFIYNALWNTDFTVRQFNHLLKFIIGLIMLQGLASIYQAFIIGQRVEGYVGFMSSIGGTTATAFPVFIIGISVMIYLFANQQFKKKNFICLILCAVSVCLVGYSSGKRAIYFLIPLIVIISVAISRLFYDKIHVTNIRKKFLNLSLLLILIFPIYISGVATAPGFRHSIEGGETNIEVLGVAIDYAKSYESATYKGSSIGRLGSTKNILFQSFSSFKYFSIGSGFGSIKDDDLSNDRDVVYGFVGFTRDVFSGGFIYAVAVTIWYIFMFFYTNLGLLCNIAKAGRWIVLVVFMLVHFFYSSDFTVHLKLTAILSLLLCLFGSPKYEHLRQYYSRFFYLK